MDPMTLQVVVALVMLVVSASVLVGFWISGIRRLNRDLRGKRARTAGDTPFCTRCGYNLTGISSEICPECGLPLTAENVRRGEVRSNWIAVADTVFFLLILLVASLLFIGLAIGG